MSAKNRKAESRADDVYMTPRWCVKRLLEQLPLPSGAPLRLLEPCVGSGHIVEAFTDMYPSVDANWVVLDIRPGVADQLEQQYSGVKSLGARDYLATHWFEEPRFDLCITNPPFSLALPFITKLRKECTTVAALLRLNWLGSGQRDGRQAFIAADHPDLMVLPNRPAFVHTFSCGGGGFYQDGRFRESACSWREQHEPEAMTLYSHCPACRGKVKLTTTDATEYMWAVWSGPPKTHGTITQLALTPKGEQV